MKLNLISHSMTTFIHFKYFHLLKCKKVFLQSVLVFRHFALQITKTIPIQFHFNLINLHNLKENVIKNKIFLRDPDVEVVCEAAKTSFCIELIVC